MKSSTLRRSFGAMYASASNVPSLPSPSGTSQAYFVATFSGSNRVIVPAPDCPSRSLLQLSSTPEARGVTKPSPVTTTRRILLPFRSDVWLLIPRLAPGGQAQGRADRQGSAPAGLPWRSAEIRDRFRLPLCQAQCLGQVHIFGQQRPPDDRAGDV